MWVVGCGSDRLRQGIGLLLVAVMLLVTACGGQAGTATRLPATATLVPATLSPTPTAGPPTEPAPTATWVPLVTRTPRPTLTPVSTRAPQVARCTTYRPAGTEGPIWDVEVAPDGTVWVAAFRGVARLHPIRKEWIPVDAGDDGASDQMRAIAATADGSVWLVSRSGDGVYRWDGESWRQLTQGDGLGSVWVNDVTLGPDGAVWFATQEGVSRWDEESGAWTYYTDEDWLYTNLVQRVLFTPDGRVWAAHSEAMRWWLPPEPDAEVGSFGTFGLTLPLATGKAIVSADGRLWVGQAVYDPESQLWQDTVYREIHLQGQAVDSAGGLWIARNDGAIYIPNPQSSPREEWVHMGQAGGMGGENVTAIALESDNLVWFGTDQGVTRCLLGGLRGP